MLRIIILFFGLVFISTPTAYAANRTVEITSTPKNVKVRVYKIDKNYDSKILGKCKTPCKLKFKTTENGKYTYYVTFNKKGYVSERDIKMKVNELSDEILRVHQTLKSAEEASAEWAAKKKAEQEIVRAAFLAKRASEIAKCKKKARTSKTLNQEAEPCLRPVPPLPVAFSVSKYSGYCDVEYDITTDGNLDNIDMICTDASLKAPTIKSLQKWLYSPTRVDSINVRTYDIQSKVKFILLNDQGDPLPFPPIP